MSGMAWRAVGGVLAIGSVGWAGFNVVELIAHEERTEVSTYDAGAVDILDVGNANGPVTIVGTAERDEITVTARISDGLRATSEQQTLVDGRLELRGSCPTFGSEWCEVKYTIELPSDVDVRADTDNGRLSVLGLAGPVDLHADNGAVEVSDVSGRLTINGDNTSITATGLTSDSVITETDNGSQTIELLEPPRSIEARSDNGSIDVVLPQTEDAYVLEISTDNGDISRDIRTDPAAARHILVETDNGDAIVRYAP
jgi:Putative adhesin